MNCERQETLRSIARPTRRNCSGSATPPFDSMHSPLAKKAEERSAAYFGTGQERVGIDQNRRLSRTNTLPYAPQRRPQSRARVRRNGIGVNAGDAMVDDLVISDFSILGATANQRSVQYARVHAHRIRSQWQDVEDPFRRDRCGVETSRPLQYPLPHAISQGEWPHVGVIC